MQTTYYVLYTESSCFLSMIFRDDYLITNNGANKTATSTLNNPNFLVFVLIVIVRDMQYVRTMYFLYFITLYKVVTLEYASLLDYLVMLPLLVLW